MSLCLISHQGFWQTYLVEMHNQCKGKREKNILIIPYSFLPVKQARVQNTATTRLQHCISLSFKSCSEPEIFPVVFLSLHQENSGGKGMKAFFFTLYF